MSLIIGIGDVHFPWANYDCLNWIYGLIKELQPDTVVQVGDLFEFNMLSRFAKFQIESPEIEWYRARKEAEGMWRAIQAAAPNAACYQLKGNHESRFAKRVMEQLPNAKQFIDLNSPFQFPGVQTQANENEEMILNPQSEDPIALMHGYASVPGQHALRNGMHTIHGHSHVGYVAYTRTNAKHWELDCGFAADPRAECFKYRMQTRLSSWTNGVGLVIGNAPIFLPFVKRQPKVTPKG